MNTRFWFWLVVFVAAHTAQAQSPLDRRVDVAWTDLPLSDALFDLSERADVGITFNEEQLPTDHRVRLRVVQTRVDTILDEMLRGTPLSYRAVGQQIVIVDAAPVRYTYSGYLQDRQTGERLIGAAVYDSTAQTGTTTNEYGFFSLGLPAGSSRIRYAYLGYKTQDRTLLLTEDRRETIELEPSIDLAPVEVLARTLDLPDHHRYANAHRTTAGQLQREPGLGGEADVLRSFQLLSGVQSGADGYGGLSVRGGSVDQNLFLLDGVPVYNGQHGYGLVSIYNTDAIRSATLYKGPFPARYGGRLSSVVDVRIKEGNNKHWQGAADVGLTSAKLTVEGPLARNRSSLFLSGRRSLIDVFSRPFSRNQRARNAGRVGEWAYRFDDLNAKVNFKLSERDKVYLSLYQGGDLLTDDDRTELSFNDTTNYVATEDRTRWGNTVGALRWNRTLSPRLFGNLALTFSRYRYSSRSFRDNRTFLRNELRNRESLLTNYQSNNQDLGVRLDFDYTADHNSRLRFGLNYTRHRFQPGIVTLDDLREENLDSLVKSSVALIEGSTPLRSDEAEAYVEREIYLTSWLHAHLGLRTTFLHVDGTTYWEPQPRAHLTATPFDEWTFFLSAGRHVQTLHLLSNTGIGLPLDLWVTSTERVRPQTSWQVAGGAQWMSGEHWTINVEGYRKVMRHLITFDEQVLSNVTASSWQDRIRSGSGDAWGVETRVAYVLPRTALRLNYTYAHTDREFSILNGGNAFPYRFDRRHALSLTGFHEFNRRWLVNWSFQYSSGMAFTIPTQEFLFTIPGFFFRDVLTIFSQRNQLRMPDQHRLDLGAIYNFGEEKTPQRLSFGIYNVYAKRNPLYFGVGSRLNPETGEAERFYTQTLLFRFFPYVRWRVEF